MRTLLNSARYLTRVSSSGKLKLIRVLTTRNFDLRKPPSDGLQLRRAITIQAKRIRIRLPQKHSIATASARLCSMALENIQRTLLFAPRIAIAARVKDAMVFDPAGIVHAISDVGVIRWNAIAKINIGITRDVHDPHQFSQHVEFKSTVPGGSFAFGQDDRFKFAPSFKSNGLCPIGANVFQAPAV